jgi:hypothetical protein
VASDSSKTSIILNMHMHIWMYILFFGGWLGLLDILVLIHNSGSGGGGGGGGG